MRKAREHPQSRAFLLPDIFPLGSLCGSCSWPSTKMNPKERKMSAEGVEGGSPWPVGPTVGVQLSSWRIFSLLFSS